MNRKLYIIGLILSVALFGLSGLEAYAFEIAIEVSFEDDEDNIGPDDLNFRDEDIISFDGTTIIQLFNGDDFTQGDEDIDAVHIDPSGVFYFSTRSGATTADGTIEFGDADVIRYDPNVTEGSPFSLFFNGQGDLDAFAIRGSKLFVSFEDEDGGEIGLNELNTVGSQVYTLDIAESGTTEQDASVAEVVLDAEELFENFENAINENNDNIDEIDIDNDDDFDVDAFTILEDGTFLFSLASSVDIDIEFNDDDDIEVTLDDGIIFQYDPNSPDDFDPLNGGIFLDSSEVFGVNVDIDAVNVIPEPASLALVFASAGLMAFPRRKLRSNALDQ